MRTNNTTSELETKRSCALCGKNIATTSDHIPPKGIYPKSQRSSIKFHTVPACQQCNNSAGYEDEEFKILIGFLTGEFRQNQQQVIDSMAKTIGSNQRLATQVFSSKRRIFTRLHNSILEPAVAVSFTPSSYIKVVQRIVRGLYWSETASCLANDAEIRVFPDQVVTGELLKRMRRLMNCLPPRWLNSYTFAYKVCFTDDGASIWGLQFFKRHTAFAYVSTTANASASLLTPNQLPRP